MQKTTKSLVAFVFGIVSHGILDYTPHCYPLSAKSDVIISVLLILIYGSLINRAYRLLTFAAFLGAVFPDVIDLSPAIINTYSGLHLPIYDKIFPWHWQTYSGSIYSGDCQVSTFNHIVLCIVILLILWNNRSVLKKSYF